MHSDTSFFLIFVKYILNGVGVMICARLAGAGSKKPKIEPSGMQLQSLCPEENCDRMKTF